MSETDPQFTGTFAGEEPSRASRAPAAKPTAAKLAAQEAAIAKYAAHHEKQARKPVKAKKPPMSLTAITIILVSCIAACITVGTLLFKLSPPRSFEANVGEYVLIATILFIFALIRVRARNR